MAAYKPSSISILLLALSVLPQAAQGLSQTTLTIAASPNPSTFGAPVTLIASVIPSNATGRVTFYDGVTILGTKPLAGGSTSFLTGLLPSGPHKLHAYYAGDSSNAAATSNVVAQTVNAHTSSGSFQLQGWGLPASDVVVADFNGDGKADVAYSPLETGGIAVNLGQGDGTFQFTFINPSLVTDVPVAVGDFNGDGKADLVVMDTNTGGVSLMLGNGSGSLQTPVSIVVVPNAFSVAVGDFNGDGKADLAIANSTNGVSILLGNGDGTFQSAVAYPTGSQSGLGAKTVTVGDFNGDGKADLATTDGSSATVSILLGNGDGTFQAPASVAVLGPPTSLAIGDFNHDSQTDLVIGHSGSLVSILLGKGDGTFQTPVTYGAIPGPLSIAVGDFNGDGNPDLALVNGSSLSILLGNGDGTFQLPFNRPSVGLSVVAVELNGDGKTDLIAPWSILLGTSLSLTATGGTPQSTFTGTAFPVQLQATFRDGANPVSGATVTFTPPAVGQSSVPVPSAVLSSASATTDASGVARVTATANPYPGSYTVTASSQGLSALFSLTNAAVTPTTLTALSGTPQSAALGTAFPNALKVKLTNSIGNPVSGVSVTFTVPASGATAVLASGTAVTDASGVAVVTATAGSIAGSYVVTASFGSLTPVTFSLTNLVQSTVTLAASPNPSTFGAPVTLTATVTPSNATGRVTFYDGVTVLGTKPLAGGSASFLTGLLPSGSRKLRAYYAGDSSNAAATSNVVAQTVNAQISTNFANGAAPWQSFEILVGDFNGDGIADLATANNGLITIWLGRGDGSFQPVAAHPTINGFGFPVAIADFNGDGKADLLVQNADVSDYLYVLTGNGDGTFQPGVKIVHVPPAVVVGDFNGDGKPDLAIAVQNGVNILLGNGDGTFQSGVLSPCGFLPGPSTTLAVGDLNGDGKADLAASNQSTNSILLGRGDGTFQSPLTDSAPTQANFILVADLNKDGKADLVTLSLSNKVSIRLGNGDGTFQAPVTIYTSPFVATVAVGDFNGDGNRDVAVGDVLATSPGNVNILLANGDGTFQSPTTFQVLGYPFFLFSGEFNGDGKTDLITSQALLLGTTLSLTATGGTPQSATVGSQFPTQLQATLRDGANPVSGATVNFAPLPGTNGASEALSTLNATTDASGVARVTATANQYPGSYTVMASFQGLSATFSLTNTDATSRILTLVSGTQQYVAFGTAVPYPLKVKLTDLAGNPVSGETVTFAPEPLLNNNFIVLSSGTAVTDGVGIASVTATAGSMAGPYTVKASVGALSVSFVLFNGPPSTVTLAAVSPNPSTFGAPVTLTATVTPSNATGRVTFYDGTTVLGTRTLSGASASFLTRLLPSGPHKLRAYYIGGAVYAASISNLIAQTVNAQPSNAFTSRASTPVSAAIPGDFNGDGITDLAVTYPNLSVGVLLGNGDGTFRSVTLNPAFNGLPVAVADFDGDGKADLLVMNSAGDVEILLGNGDGTFQAAVNTGYTGLSAVVGDFNGDGKPDLAIADILFGVTILLGKGDGTFQPSLAYHPALGATILAVADLNGDGKADLIASNGFTVTVLLANGDGTFHLLPGDSAQTLPTYIVVTDLNGDGKPDLVTVSNPNKVSIQLGNGDGTFGAPVVAFAAQAATRAAVGDFNGDGNADIAIFGAISAQTDNNVSILLGNGDGTFRPPINYPANSPTSVLVAGDFNGDGKTDLLTGGSLLLGTTWSLTATGGTPQSAQLGAAFPNALQATLKDSAGNPVSGVTVTFAAPPTGASATLSSLTAVTNASGVASVTATANNTAGSYTVSANAGMLSMSFSLTNTSTTPTSITATGGTPQSTAVGAAFGNALQATVKDSLGNPVTGVTVIFAAPPTGASATLSSATAVTNASGIASVTATANSIAGSYTVTANVGALSALFSLTNTSGQTASVTATGGTPQSAPLSTAFAIALQATMRDSTGNPMSGVTVTFAAPLSGASATLSSPTAVTNASGVASVTATANSIAGSYFVTASVGALLASFSLTNTSGTGTGTGTVPASIAAAGGTPQSAPSGTAFATALQVTVRDSAGNPVPGVTVTFGVPLIGASAVLSSSSTPTNASGVASVTATANGIMGSYTITATVVAFLGPGGVFSTSFSLTNTPPTYASITATGGTPQSAPLSTAFATALQATVKDSIGNPVSGITVTFAAPSTGAGAVLSSTTAQTNLSGIATVTATANNIAGGYTVTASVGSFSTFFSLTNLSGGGGSSNLALGKTATQSSTFPGYSTAGAAAAVDGSTDGNFGDGSVTATNLDPNPWWQVDLGASAAVTSVVIFNRIDCCGSRLNDYWVFISDTPFLPTDTPSTLQNRAGTFASHQTVAPNPSTTITASAQGRYLRVQLTTANYLSLAEVQVFGTGGAPPPTNLAQAKVATQSSTFPGYSSAAASSAVDGNTDGNFGDGSVTATNADLNAWWQVDLGASAAINSVTVWNRADCCGSRLSDYWVFISNTPFLPTDTPTTLQNRAGTFASHQTAAPNLSTIVAANGAQGRYVRVQLTGTDYLSLAEVQVFGTGGSPASTNVAQGKAASQSSTFPGFATDGAAAAVDGNTDGNFGNGSVTATNLDPNSWWQVDLGASTAVSSVVVWNRTDCCSSRLNDYWVFISDTPFLATDTPTTLQSRAGTFSSHQTTAPNSSTPIAAGAQGRYVRVQLTSPNYLSLAEVQVFGQ